MNNLRITSLIASIALVALGGMVVAQAGTATPVVKRSESGIVAKCRQDLAKRLHLAVNQIKVASDEPTVWPDTALGMPEPGRMYAQVLTPGSRLILEANRSRYLYTTGAKAYKYGGPVAAWSCSWLYLQPVENEPNLNCDLYQCSLVGTNGIRLASGVSDYYPQDNGSVIIKRRTSRSGHDLLYVKANEPGKAKMLYQAFDFGAAAFNSSQTEWAGYVRPSLGFVWNVVVARVGKQDASDQVLPLPEGFRPGKIAWSGDKLMIMASKDGRFIAYETSPKSATPEWKTMNSFDFPGQRDYVLNKSQSLEIEQVGDNVEIAKVWFTGSHDVVATINNFKLQGYDLLGRYAFVWSENGAYAVDISTGDTLRCFPKSARDMRPFNYPPHNRPTAETIGHSSRK